MAKHVEQSLIYSFHSTNNEIKPVHRMFICIIIFVLFVFEFFSKYLYRVLLYMYNV